MSKRVPADLEVTQEFEEPFLGMLLHAVPAHEAVSDTAVFVDRLPKCDGSCSCSTGAWHRSLEDCISLFVYYISVVPHALHVALYSVIVRPSHQCSFSVASSSKIIHLIGYIGGLLML